MTPAGETLALFLALVLLSAAGHKAIQPARMEIAAARLTGTSLRIGRMLAMLAAAVELIAAIAIVMVETRVIGAGLGTVLWVTYGLLLLRSSLRDDAAFDCGCGFGQHARPIGFMAVARAFGLALIALATAVLPASGFGVAPTLAAIAFFSLYVAVNEIAALPTPGRGHAL